MSDNASREQPSAGHSQASGVLRNPIGFLLMPHFTVLSLASAIEPLRIANRYISRPYQWRLYSPDGQIVEDDNGIQITPDGAAPQAGSLGTLLICADQHPERSVTSALAQWLRRIAHQGTRIVSIDSAAFVLAKVGLLKGHPVTMHWEVTSAFAERYPEIEVINTLFEIGEGPISCAGGTAVLDLMLTLIEADHGEAVSQKVAEHCVREKLRRGGESQRMKPPHERLSIAMQAGESAIDGRIEVAEIARLVGVSERQLLRLYRRYLGQSPSQFHLAQRLDRARALLRSTSMTVTEVGTACGFSSPAHFARAFRKAYGHAPSGERKRRPQGLLADRQSHEQDETQTPGDSVATLARQTSRKRYG
ncbi:MAG: GlxA family transcriptional regulator [Burkholderiaceae bacterium]